YDGHEEDNPCIKFKTTIDVTVYFETSASIMKKIDMYDRKKIKGIGFWRLSMEPENFWEKIKSGYLK
ncbi:MAG: hypothetical protein JW982_17205, partial [Spirochaetes bacterium]|nr:hypothetical protein [Spirochaetota bacterium]